MRMIDIEAVLKAAELAGKEYVSIDFLKDFEQVDAVPVVRCRYCVKRHTPDCAMWYKCSVCNGQWSWENNDDFCSYGAKLEDKPCG